MAYRRIRGWPPWPVWRGRRIALPLCIRLRAAHAVLAAWAHAPERAIAQLREALAIAEELGAAGEKG